MGWIIRILLVLLIIRAVWRLLGGIIQGAASVGPAGSKQGGVALVRDPVCGTYVVPTRALSARAGDDDIAYFCSEKCRAAFAAKR
jgi:YHS domain-containing protein